MKKQILSIFITQGSFKSQMEKILQLASTKTSSYVCVANVHMLVEAHNDKAFADVVNNADVATPDGMPIAKSFQYLYGIHQPRVAGMDILPYLLSKSQQAGLPVFFYGGTDDMLNKTRQYCREHYAQLNIAGMISPPFRSLTAAEQNEHINQINNSGACLVFVALGCPKQEKWMADMKGSINACMVGIGGALPVMIGLQKRAPQWLQTLSLEWLYRLVQEPRRLFKRYAVTNSAFIMLLTKELVKGKKHRKI